MPRSTRRHRINLRPRPKRGWSPPPGLTIGEVDAISSDTFRIRFNQPVEISVLPVANKFFRNFSAVFTDGTEFPTAINVTHAEFNNADVLVELAPVTYAGKQIELVVLPVNNNAAMQILWNDNAPPPGQRFYVTLEVLP